jgi:hypothetical protein
MKNIYFTLSIIFCSSYLQSNPLNGFSVGVSPSIGIVGGGWATFTSIPVGATVVLTTPYGFKLGPIDYAVSLAFGGYSGKGQGETRVDEYNPSLIGFGGNLLVARFITAEFHAGIVGQGFGYRGFSGLSLERFTKNIPINLLVGSEFFFSSDIAGSGNASGWISITARVDYPIGGKVNRKSNVGGPSASVDGADGRPADCGSAEIDNFKNAAFDLNDKIVELKEKLKGVSNGLTESNKVLSEIGNSSSGPVGWALVELQKGFSQSKNSITSAVQSLKSDIPDLPEIYFALIKESMISPETLEELLKGTEPEEALVATFNKKAKEKGVPTTSKEWIKSLNLELDPTKALKLKLGKINEGIVGGKDKLVSVPDDLKAIGEQAKSLLASAGELPKAAKSLGFSKAPAALKAIKATTGVLKNIPNEVTAIGDETKKIIEEIENVLNNIKNILS